MSAHVTRFRANPTSLFVIAVATYFVLRACLAPTDTLLLAGGQQSGRHASRLSLLQQRSLPGTIDNNALLSVLLLFVAAFVPVC